MSRWSRKHLLLIALGSLAAISGVCLGYRAWISPKEQSLETAEQKDEPTPRPSVSHDLDDRVEPHLVGIDTCAGCHQEQQKAHATSGHSRTFIHSSQSEFARSLNGQTFTDPERGYSFLYKFDPQAGLSVSIPNKLSREFPLHYVLGSGAHAVSFVGLVPGEKPNEPTFGIEHRVSFGPKKNGERHLKVTFGHQNRKPDTELSYFGVLADPQALHACVDCHVTSGKISGTHVENLKANVTCESCHGPGSKHVAAATRGVDQPGHLRFTPGSYTPEQQIELCGKCHRVAEMCPVEQVGRDKVSLTRFHPVGMKFSRCFKESGGGMSCNTCHDHHRGTEHDPKYYATKCLQCHGDGRSDATSCPVSATEGCVKCHMPAVPWLHGAFTDHWIRVRDDRDPAPPYEIPKPSKRRD